MDVDRKRFLAALALFVVWVAVLGVLVVTSSRPPAAAPAVANVPAALR
jgi:hypothetical protein